MRSRLCPIWLLAAGLVSLLPAAEDIQIGAPGSGTAPGGNATANATSADASNRAQATAGAGAAGSGLGGGTATATAGTTNSTPGILTSTTASATGGAGGPTYDPAAHPPGGAANALALVTGGAAGQIIELLATALGGNGGAAFGNYGVAGNAGNATASVSAEANGAASILGQAQATGGTPTPGGSQIFPTGGGQGGSALVSGMLVNVGGDSATLELQALGGNGGPWYGQPGNAPFPAAGTGGSAGASGAFAQAERSAAVRIVARGGDGGGAYRGSGGQGGAAELINVANGAAGGSVTLEQQATAGNGGSAYGTTGAAGGNATSVLDRTITTERLVGTVSALAGRGGDTAFSNGNGIAGATGRARSSLRLVNPGGSVLATATARTPDVTWVAGSTDTASADATAISGQERAGEGAAAVADATGGRSRTSLFYGFGPAGAAAAQATADSASGNTLARATATGGTDRGNTTVGFGGDATATATATNRGAGSLTSEAIALGGAANFLAGSPPVRGHGGDATATATGLTPGVATVRAEARAGQGASDAQFDFGTYRAGLASATAQGTATSGVISAVASTVGARLPVTNVSASSSGTLNGSSTHLALATAGVAAGASLVPGARQGAALAIGAPLPTDAATALAGNPTALGRFDLVSTNQRLLLASLGAAHGLGSSPGPQQTTLTLGLTVDLSQIPALEQQHLQLALLGSSALGGGFSSLHLSVQRAGATVVEVTFLSLAEAQTYFSDQVLDLGQLPQLATGTLDLAVTLQITTAAEGDAFAAAFFVGNAAVPEPATWLLSSLGLGLWLGLRRRG